MNSRELSNIIDGDLLEGKTAIITDKQFYLGFDFESSALSLTPWVLSFPPAAFVEKAAHPEWTTGL